MPNIVRHHSPMTGLYLEAMLNGKQPRLHISDLMCDEDARRVSSFILMKMTSSNGYIFRVTGPLCGEFTGPGEFPTQRPVTRSFEVFFDLRLNQRLSKHPWGWWFETPSWSLWRQCNVNCFCNGTAAGTDPAYNLIPSATIVQNRLKLNCHKITGWTALILRLNVCQDGYS